MDNTKDILQAIPLDVPLAPPLPVYACLSDEHVAAAHQTGQWLEAFVAFASAASPLTPPYRRKNSEHKPVLARIV